MENSQLILLVDDDTDDQDVFNLAINSIAKPIKVITAGNGEEAIDLLLNYPQKPTAIFLDLNMPRMNGCQFLRTIRDYSGLNDIPVFVYSTSSNSADIAETKRLGAKRFFTKPDNIREIATIVKDALEAVG
jgi:CheY-like chemotaxis protein